MREIRQKTLRALAAGFIALAIAWVVVPTPGESATFTFKCTTATLNDVQHEWCKRYGARLEKRSNGQIKTQIFPASQLGSIPRMIEGVQLGTIECWLGPPEFMVGIDSRFQMLTAPYLFDSVDHAYKVVNDREFWDRFLSLAEGKGIKGVGLLVYGPISFGAKFPIRTPDDLRGKKVRVLATPIEQAMMAALGATGVPMPLSEVLPALQQGALDAVESALTVFTTFKYYDVAKYFTNTNHYIVVSIAAVSKKWFDSLPADLQHVMLEEARAIQPELLEWTKNFFRTAETVWKEKTKDGWIELTPEQRAAFRQRFEGVDAKVAQEVPGLKEWLDLLRAKARALR